MTCEEISRCQNEREAGSESIARGCLGSFGGTGFERITTTAAYLAEWTATTVVSDAVFFLLLLRVLSLQAIPSAFTVMVSTQFPNHFGNVLLREKFQRCYMSSDFTALHHVATYDILFCSLHGSAVTSAAERKTVHPVCTLSCIALIVRLFIDSHSYRCRKCELLCRMSSMS